MFQRMAVVYVNKNGAVLLKRCIPQVVVYVVLYKDTCIKDVSRTAIYLYLITVKECVYQTLVYIFSVKAHI